MRAAALIQAHQHPELVAALVRSLTHPAVDVYLHIDRKVSDAPFARALAALAPRASVTFVDDRVDVHWGGFSQVRATLNLVAAARRGGRYQRFALLSGSDVLVRPVDDVLEAWSGTTEYLRVDRRIAGTSRQAHVARRHFHDHAAPWRRRLSGRIPRAVDDRIPLYQGSQWWALTASAIDVVERFCDLHSDWLRFHRHSFCADELVFGSILKASSVADRLSHDVDRVGSDAAAVAAFHSSPIHGMHYIDWSDPHATSPRVLGLADLPALRASGALVARKIDPTSADLVTALTGTTAP